MSGTFEVCACESVCFTEEVGYEPAHRFEKMMDVLESVCCLAGVDAATTVNNFHLVEAACGVDVSKTAVAVPMGTDYAGSDVVCECGAIARNRVGHLDASAVESVAGSVTDASCYAALVDVVMCVGGMLVGSTGCETRGKIAGTAGMGYTGRVVVRSPGVPGVCASGHVCYESEVVCVVGTEPAGSGESSVNLDTASSYSFSMIEICGPPDVEKTVCTKDGVASANRVCGVTADNDVSVVVSNGGKSVGVGTDAPDTELLSFEGHVSVGVKNRASMFYAVPSIEEVTECRVATEPDNARVRSEGYL